MIKFSDLPKQYFDMKFEIDSALREVINDSSFIKGKYVDIFEENFSKYINVKNCIGVANGTDGLEIAIESLKIDKGNDIIVPANSFISSSESVTRNQLKVVFVDIDIDTYVIDLNDLKKKITSNTAAILAVHLYGHPCNMNEINAIAKKNNLFVIEDCAQAHGALYKNKKIGNLGTISAFSFYPGKNLGAFGDAGAICTDNEVLAKRCRMIANHGRLNKYDHEFEGRNSRLDTIHAAVLNIKLKYLDKWIQKRNNNAQNYHINLQNNKYIKIPKIESYVKHAFHLYVIQTEKRNELKNYLYENSIQTGIHYPIALSKLKAYRYLNQYNEKMVANKIGDTLLSLPIGEHIEKKDVDFICNKINDFFE